MFLESVEIDHAFGENSVHERTCAAQQLGGRIRRWRGGRPDRRGVDGGLYFPDLCALFMKFARGQLSEVATSVCHKRELDAEREVGERLQLVVARWYDLLALSPAVAEERRIVADQNNHGNAVAELDQDLLNELRVDLVEANVDLAKRPVPRRKVPRFGELTLRVGVREFHRVLTSIRKPCHP